MSRRALDELAEVLGPVTEPPLAALLEPGADAERALAGTDVAQPALYALALRARRVVAHAGVGRTRCSGTASAPTPPRHSPGCSRRRTARGSWRAAARLMAGLAPGGAMAARWPPRSALGERWTATRTSPSPHNAPDETVLSGPEERRGRARRADEAARQARRSRSSTAFHSALVEPALRRSATLADHSLRRRDDARVRHDRRGAGAEVADPAYWVEHARRTVDASRPPSAGSTPAARRAGAGSTLLGLAPPSRRRPGARYSRRATAPPRSRAPRLDGGARRLGPRPAAGAAAAAADVPVRAPPPLAPDATPGKRPGESDRAAWRPGASTRRAPMIYRRARDDARVLAEHSVSAARRPRRRLPRADRLGRRARRDRRPRSPSSLLAPLTSARTSARAPGRLESAADGGAARRPGARQTPARDRHAGAACRPPTRSRARSAEIRSRAARDA